jgi:hypothetical protein
LFAVVWAVEFHALSPHDRFYYAIMAQLKLLAKLIYVLNNRGGICFLY